MIGLAIGRTDYNSRAAEAIELANPGVAVPRAEYRWNSSTALTSDLAGTCARTSNTLSSPAGTSMFRPWSSSAFGRTSSFNTLSRPFRPHKAKQRGVCCGRPSRLTGDQVSLPRLLMEEEPCVKDWVEKKSRRHMLRARNRQGFGWARWSRGWLYQTLKLLGRS